MHWLRRSRQADAPRFLDVDHGEGQVAKLSFRSFCSSLSSVSVIPVSVKTKTKPPLRLRTNENKPGIPCDTERIGKLLFAAGG